MCGIAGFTHRHRRPDPRLIQQLTTCLAHRGPDQHGTHTGSVASLGAVRLKVIDLHGGDQPFQTEDGRLTLVFNGEVYNHRDLRAELESLGHRFRSHCDTEVVLRAFDQWDVESFRRLRGMFALAVWSEPDRRLVLARDRLGIKPLYTHRRDSDLHFGSELKAILLHPDVERRLDLTGLGYYLSLNWVPWPYTLVQDVRKLRPGHWLEWRDGVIREEPYWELAFQPDPRITLNTAKEELDALLQSAVREELVADVPLGIWASGGVDSTTILHYARQAHNGPLKTFSVSFQGLSCDESRYFRPIAQHYATEHHEFDLNPSVDLAGAIHDLATYSDEPGADAGALPVWFLSRLTRQHVTVALSGEGADELFGGYQTYLADKLAATTRLAPAPLRRLGLDLLNHWPVSDEKISLEYKAKRMLRGSLLPPDEAHLYWNGTLTAEERRQLCPPAVAPDWAALYASLPPGATGLNRYLQLDQHYYLADDILYKADRMSSAHSLEVRPPFLDHRLVEFAARLPESFKVRGHTLKFLLRELIRDKVPPLVLQRGKEGFDIPAHQWFRGPLRPLLEETLSDDVIRDNGLLEPAAVRRLVSDHVNRRANLGYPLWGLLTLLVWMRRWNVTLPAAASVPATVATS